MKKSLIRTMLLGTAVASSVAVLSATPTISKAENNAKCTVCHVKAGSKDLNKVGDCYKKDKDLKACTAANPTAAIEHISSYLGKLDNGK